MFPGSFTHKSNETNMLVINSNFQTINYFELTSKSLPVLFGEMQTKDNHTRVCLYLWKYGAVRCFELHYETGSRISKGQKFQENLDV